MFHFLTDPLPRGDEPSAATMPVKSGTPGGSGDINASQDFRAVLAQLREGASPGPGRSSHDRAPTESGTVGDADQPAEEGPGRSSHDRAPTESGTVNGVDQSIEEEPGPAEKSAGEKGKPHSGNGDPAESLQNLPKKGHTSNSGQGIPLNRSADDNVPVRAGEPGPDTVSGLLHQGARGSEPPAVPAERSDAGARRGAPPLPEVSTGPGRLRGAPLPGSAGVSAIQAGPEGAAPKPDAHPGESFQRPPITSGAANMVPVSGRIRSGSQSNTAGQATVIPAPDSPPAPVKPDGDALPKHRGQEPRHTVEVALSPWKNGAAAGEHTGQKTPAAAPRAQSGQAPQGEMTADIRPAPAPNPTQQASMPLTGGMRGDPVTGLRSAPLLADTSDAPEMRGHADAPQPVRSGPVAASTMHGQPGETARSAVQQIATAIQNNGERAFELRLNPAELGKIRISLTPGDGGMTVNIVADRPETLDLLRRHVNLLAEDFRDIGYDDTAFSFGEDSRGQEPGTAPEGKAAADTELPEGMADAGNPDQPAARRTSPSGRMDIRI